MISLAQQKKIILDILIPLSKQYGYEYTQIVDMPYFRQVHEQYVLNSSIYWYSNGEHVFGYELSINVIEDIIMDIGTPVNDFTAHKNREVYLATFGDYTALNLRRSIKIETEEDAIEFANYVGNLLNGRMLEFTEYYSHLPNVLAEMNRLEAEGKYWNGILGGLADYLFRGLIISKLCNDDDFERKVQYCDEKLNSRPSLAIWLPYYEKLKARLQNLQPMYNV